MIALPLEQVSYTRKNMRKCLFTSLPYDFPLDSTTFAGMNYSAVLFDLDGVLVDSETAYSHFWGAQFARFRPELPGMESRIKGQPLPVILDALLPNDSSEERSEVVAALDRFEQEMHYPYMPGARRFLHELRKRKIPMALVTGSNRQKMKHVYTRHPLLFRYFSTVVTADDVSQGKPYPEGFLEAARRLGVAPDRCIVFEDSLNGLRAAGAAGCMVVGLSTTLEADVIAPLCTRVIPHFREATPDSF